MMSDKDKVIEYELQIEDMLHAINERLSEFGDGEDLNDFEQGRQLAYTEIMEIIKTRHQMILEVLSED
jgi:hypothetical protein